MFETQFIDHISFKWLNLLDFLYKKLGVNSELGFSFIIQWFQFLGITETFIWLRRQKRVEQDLL